MRRSGYMEEPLIRRRSRLKHHYTMVSNVIIFGYRGLTDAEKITYEAIDSFDWPDERGERKGYAYPSLRTLERLRGLTERTLRRHLASLEQFGLLRREQRPGRPTLLWIEEPSEEESGQYLSTVAIGPDMDVRGTPDTDVRPDKEDERQERQNPGLLKEERTLSAEEVAKREWLAGEMLEVVGQPRDRKFYVRVAATVPEHRIFEALSEVKLAAHERRIKTSKAALFASLVRARPVGRAEEEHVRKDRDRARGSPRGTAG